MSNPAVVDSPIEAPGEEALQNEELTKRQPGTGAAKFRKTAQLIRTLAVKKKVDGEGTDEVKDSFLAKYGTASAHTVDRNTGSAAEPIVYKNPLKRFWYTWVLDPASDFYYRWLTLFTVIVLYNTMMIIARAVLPNLNEANILAWMMCDYVSDLLYVLDMFISSRRTYLEDGLVVRDPGRLRWKYRISVQFRVDVLSLLPTDFLYIFFTTDLTIARINRVLRIGRIAEFFDRNDSRTNYPHAFRVAQMVIYVIIIYHWNACLFYQISSWIGFCSDAFVYFTNNCSHYMVVSNPESLLTTYTYTFYWSTLMLSTIGDVPHPVLVSEYIYVIVVFLVGILIFAAIIGNVGSIISSMNSNREAYQEKMDGVKRYMALRKVNPELQTKVISWFDYVWNDKQAVEEEEVLSVLPQKLKAEMAMHVHLATLKRVAIFQECEAGLLAELVLKLKPTVYSPGDYVCLKGDIGKELYIIKRGKLQVVNDDGSKVFATLGDGVVFGEISILNIPGNKNGNKRTANIRSVGYTDLYVLSKEDLWETLAEYPEAKNRLMEKGREQLKKDNLLDEDLARIQEANQLSPEEKLCRLETSVELLLEQVNKLARDFNTVQRSLKKSITAAEQEMKRQLDLAGIHDNIPFY